MNTEGEINQISWQIKGLLQSNEQRKNDIRHAWNEYKVLREEIQLLRDEMRDSGKKINQHLEDHAFNRIPKFKGFEGGEEV